MSSIALLIDYGFCSGCHSCELACRNELGLALDEWGIKVLEDGPRKNRDGSFQWDYVPHPTDLCHGCIARVEKGLAPACVQTCQGKVMYYGSSQEMAAKLEEIGENAMIYIVGDSHTRDRAISYEYDLEASSYKGESIEFGGTDVCDEAAEYYLWKYSYGKAWELLEQSSDKAALEESKRKLAIEKASARASNYGEDYMFKITDHIPSEEEMLK